MYGHGPRTSRKSKRDTTAPYIRDAAQRAATMANLEALARSGTLGWLPPPMNVQQQIAASALTASSRRGSRVGGLNIQIPSSIAGLVPGMATSIGQIGQTPLMGTTTEVREKFVGFKKMVEVLLAALADANTKIIKDGKVDPNKVMDKELKSDKLPTDAPNKDKILAFTDKLGVDQWAEVLGPSNGRIAVTEPISAVFLSPVHYVETMKIASLSSTPLNLGSQSGVSTCDDARTILPTLAMQPYADVLREVAESCTYGSSQKVTDWLKIETARGRFWFYLWIGLWSKYTQNIQYANSLVSTGNKFLIYYSIWAKYGVPYIDGAGTNAVGVLLMLIRGLVAAGWASRVPLDNPNYIFEQWIVPILKDIYKENGFEFK